MHMTIQELYYFAINHSLLDEKVDTVIREYNKELTKVETSKIEYTLDDLLLLFSN